MEPFAIGLEVTHLAEMFDMCGFFFYACTYSCPGSFLQTGMVGGVLGQEVG